MTALLNGKIQDYSTQTGDQFAELVALTANASQSVRAQADALYNQVKVTVIGALLAVSLLTVLLAWLLIRSIVVPIRQAVDVAEQVAAGDLGTPIHSHGGDETARLLTALSIMQTSLRETLQRISAASTPTERSRRANATEHPAGFRATATATQRNRTSRHRGQ